MTKKKQKLQEFLKANDLKIVWLAGCINISPEMLRYYFKHDTLPEELERKALAAIAKQATILYKFATGETSFK